MDAPALLLRLRQQARLAAYKALTSFLLTPSGGSPVTESPATIESVPSTLVSHKVTPYPSPQLISLIRAAAAIEPTSLSLILRGGGVKRGHVAGQVKEEDQKNSLSGERNLPPKKRSRRRVVSPPPPGVSITLVS